MPPANRSDATSRSPTARSAPTGTAYEKVISKFRHTQQPLTEDIHQDDFNPEHSGVKIAGKRIGQLVAINQFAKAQDDEKSLQQF